MTHKIALTWPVPASPSKMLPASGRPGSFWENRGDRFHCGVDIYAPFGSKVWAVDDGFVVKTELFTLQRLIDYWNDTYAVTIEHKGGLIVRYAEMCDIVPKTGASVAKGECIGLVGQVLEPVRITEQAPPYIRQLKRKKNPTMLHLEMLNRYPFHIPDYLGGNTFQNVKPECLLDPTLFWG